MHGIALEAPLENPRHDEHQKESGQRHDERESRPETPGRGEDSGGLRTHAPVSVQSASAVAEGSVRMRIGLSAWRLDSRTLSLCAGGLQAVSRRRTDALCMALGERRVRARQ